MNVKNHEIKFKSSRLKTTKTILSSGIDWGDFDIKDLIDKMVKFSTVLTGMTLHPYQEDFQRRIFHSILKNDGDEITALFARQSGKCLAKDIPIRMYDGSVKTSQSIKKGDLLMGDDLTSREVTSVTKGESQLYSVLPRDILTKEEAYVCNDEHILTVYYKNTTKDIPVKEVIKLLNKGTEVFGIKKKYTEKIKLPKLYPIKITPGDYRTNKQVGSYYGFTLNKNKRFLLGNNVVTHNTETVACSVDTLMVLMPILAGVFPEQLSRFKKGIHIGLFAPVSEQADTTHQRMDLRLSSDTAAEVLADGDIAGKKKYSGGKLTVEGGMHTNANGETVPSYVSFCKVQSAAKQAKIESKTYHVIILEEAQELDTMKVEKSIHPMVASTNGSIIKIGTPLPKISNFYYACMRGKHSRNNKTHFEYNYKVVQKYNAFYKAYISKEKIRLGEDSDAFRLAYNLEWLLEKGMAMTEEMYEEFLRVPSLKFEYEKQPNTTYAAGLDLARSSDSTVLTVAKIENLKVKDINDLGKDFATRKTIVNWLEIKNEKWEEQIVEILAWVERYDLKVITIDATGKGDPIAERLDRALEFTECKVIPVVFSLKTKNDMAVLFYQELRQHRILIPGHQSAEKSKRVKAFKLQLLTCEKVYKNKYMQLVHADVKNARDDYVDSLLLLCYGVEQYQAPFIKTNTNVFFEEPGQHSSRYSKRLNQIRKKSSAKWRKSGEITKLK